MMHSPLRFWLVNAVFLFCSATFLPPSLAEQTEEAGGPQAVAASRTTPTIGNRGMVVSDDHEASAWGAEILRRGGNAVDAAVATAFVMSVTRPHFASLGGGGFLIFCPKPKNDTPSSCTVIDFRERAPRGSRAEMYLRDGKVQTELAQNGPLAVGVPGVPAGLLLALKKFGKFPRQSILTRPILLAKKGYTFTAHSESSAYNRWPAMNAAAKKIFGCKQGNDLLPCTPGSMIRQPELAHVLELIAKKGEKGFYTGPVATQIAKGIQQAGGILSVADLAGYQATLRTPLVGKFEDWEVVTMPPPSSGGAILLQLLGYAERAKKQGAFKNGYGSSESIHAILHAMSLAFADRAHHYGDPDFIKNPLPALLTPEYLDHQWETFNSSHANLPKGPGQIPNEPQHTTHLSVMDRDGNAVALTTTVNDFWGSGFVPPGTGIVMNNEMDDFSAKPGAPNLFRLVGDQANAIAPGKRPLSSMTPTIVRDRAGQNSIVLGAAGGPRIPTSVFLSLANHLIFGLSFADAVAAPRFHHQWKPEGVVLEKNGFPLEIKSALEKKGYTLGAWNIKGIVHALRRFPNGRVWGVADTRGEGAAAAE